MVRAGALATIAALAFCAAATPVARADGDSCWQMINAALVASARAPHAHFISYGERATILSDGHTLVRSSSNITYRDDGLAYINDDRWVYPFLTERLDPGPPVLGPYGRLRSAWLSLGDDASPLPVIADVHNPPSESCHDAGSTVMSGRANEHLVVGAEHPNRGGLHEIWIDPTNFDITRIVVRGPLLFYVDTALKADLTNFVVDVEHVNGYSVVQRVTWEYRERYYSQYSNLSAEYDFSNYAFSDAPPPQSVRAWTAVQ